MPLEHLSVVEKVAFCASRCVSRQALAEVKTQGKRKYDVTGKQGTRGAGAGAGAGR
jgi:hypothetical protein